MQLASSGGITNVNGLKIDAGGVTNAMLAGSIEDSKLKQITTGNKVAGSAVQLASNSAIENSSGLKLKSTVAGTGLNMTNQVLAVDVSQSLTDLSVSNTLTATNIGAFTATGAIDFNSQAMTNVDINSGSIDGTNITVGSQKSLDVSAGSLVTSSTQKLAILEGAEDNIVFGSYDVKASTFTSSSLTESRVVFAGANGTMVDSSGLVFENDKIKSKIFAGLDISGLEQTGYIEIKDNNIWFQNVLPRTNQTRSLQDGGDDDYVFLTKAAADATYARSNLIGDDGLPVSFDTAAYFKKDTLLSDRIGNLHVEDITMYGNFITNDVSINENLYVANKITAPRVSGFTVEGAIDFSNQSMTHVNIDSGAIDGTNITVGSQKSLDVSDGTFTTSQQQKIDILQGADANIDFGTFDLCANTFTSKSLTGGRVVFSDANGTLVDNTNMSFSTDTLTVTKLGAFEATGAINFASQNMTNVDIDSGTIDGTDITVGSDKTLDVSAGTFTTSQQQKIDILQGADANIDFGTFDLCANTFTSKSLTGGRVVFSDANGTLVDNTNMSFSTDTLTVTKLGAFKATGAINFSNQSMNNVNIDSGAIDGTNITVGLNKSLDVSAGSLVTSATQKRAILEGADNNINFGAYEISANSLNVSQIGAFKATGAIDFNDQAMTKVNIDSGVIGSDVSYDLFSESNQIPYSNSNYNLIASNELKYFPGTSISRLQVGGAGGFRLYGATGLLKYGASTLDLSGIGTNTITFPEETGTVLTTTSTLDGSNIQLSENTAIRNANGLKLKTSLAGTGLTIGADGNNNQILSVDAAQTQITSVGSLTGLDVSGHSTFVTMSEKIESAVSDTFYYSTGSVFWSNVSAGATTKTFTINDIPDLANRPHIVTVIMEAPATDRETHYANSVNVGSGAITPLWNGGALPDLSETVEGDIIIQQFSILPSSLITNNTTKVLTSVTFYKTGA